MNPLIFFLPFIFFLLQNERRPMEVNFRESAAYRWLNKEVLERRMLDEMEDPSTWSVFTQGGGQVVDARVVARTAEADKVVCHVEFTGEMSSDGGKVMKMTIPTKLDAPGPGSGRAWGSAGVRRLFPGEDWGEFNRVSIWIRPENPGTYVTSLELRLYNEGNEKLPALFGQEGEHNLVLRNQEWNHIVWEIGNVARDKVTKFEVSYSMFGNEPGEADTAIFYLDRLELEKVEPDYVEGWEVWPGRISYSHAGYQPGEKKTAIASKLSAKEFRIISQEKGLVVLTKPIHTIQTHLGNFQVMDFSEVQEPGSYVLEAGGISTHSFLIHQDAWRSSILKALNFFYAERCGYAVPGIHGICHRDWTVTHGNERIVINGGWHDAGDLTQGLGNTAEITYSLFAFAEKLGQGKEDHELYERLLEEANWGLEWIIKTSFRDGYRNTGSISSRKTNGIIGDFDDLGSTARNTPMTNFTASAPEAIAYRILRNRDPRWAKLALKMAEEDWEFAVEGMAKPDTLTSKQIWRGTFDSDNVAHEVAAAGVLASLDLWKATGNVRYADKAAELAHIIMDSQQKEKPDWDIPLNGFFYTSPSKDHILHYCHRGREQGHVLALALLCESFPDHSDWMKWYSTIALYSRYLETITKYTEPYHVFPASVYSDQEYKDVPESRKESFRNQVLNGIPLGKGYYLRLFPVWMDYRGHFGTILPQAQAVVYAARLRNDLEAVQLAQDQVKWIIGQNPFSQSTMWGEGHDYPPLYIPCSGDIVGSLPVGIQTRGDSDIPYWPIQNTWTYKEVWVHPVARWIWLMKDLTGPAWVEGIADEEIVIENTLSRETNILKPGPGGRFDASLPQGNYRIITAAMEVTRSLLPGVTYNLDLRAEELFDFEVSRTISGNSVTIKLTARGNGTHNFNIRTENLDIGSIQKTVSLKPGQPAAAEWKGKINSQDMPWFAVVIADNNMLMKREITGD
jgi:hypothetical protein